MSSRKLLGILLSLVAAVWLPTLATAVCSGGLSNENSIGFERFGLQTDGSRSWVGEQFVSDCDAQFLTVRFQVSLGLLPVGGVAPLSAGQILVCTVMDDQNRDIASVDNVLEGGLAPQWVEFDFSPLSLGLAAGTLGVRVETPADGYAYVQTSSNLVAGDLLVSDGTDIFTSTPRDATFAVIWDANADVVGNEEASWGAVKALFR